MLPQTHIRVFPNRVIGPVSRWLTGACIEDVNHEIYGGIYSQMLFGESFEEEPMDIAAAGGAACEGISGTLSCRAERTHLRDESPVRSWQPLRRGTAEGRLEASVLRARRGRRSQMIRFERGKGRVGIENRGLNRWGLALQAHRLYEGTIVLLSEAPTKVYLSLESADGARVYAEQALLVPGDGRWQICTFELTPDTTENAARFAISLNAPGAVWIDYVALHPGPWGRFHDLPVRNDIAQALVAQGLTVLRCGGTMINTDWNAKQRATGPGYRWKNMTGPRSARPPFFGHYYVHASNGFGVPEFVALCKAAGMLAVPALSPSEDPADIVDLIEYMNGDASTRWGQQRVADGYPEPLGLRYIEIGNEELTEAPGPGGTRRLVRQDYGTLFKAHADAIATADPTMTIIAAPWLYNEDELDYPENIAPVRQILEAARGRNVLWDVHVGGDGLRDADTAERFIGRLRAWLDELDPDNQIGFCVLEENGGRHDLQRALGHAHMVNTMERLAGAVVIDCPANCLQPWKQNDNGWDQGQLFFTPDQVWGMPPYYAQQLIAHHYQPLCIHAESEGDGDALDVTATRSEDGRTLVLKMVNLEERDIAALIELGAAQEAGWATVACLRGPLDAENTPTQPCRIVPETRAQPWDGQKLTCTLPAHSFTVVQLQS